MENPLSSPRGMRDKVLMAFLKRHAIHTGQTRFLEKLHQDFWSGEGGAVFSQNCDHRFNDLFLSKQRLDYEKLSEIWSELRPDKIVEFGCNSGLLLNYLTQNLPDVYRAIGIDINATQIQANLASGNFDRRVSFECEDARDWLFDQGRPNSLFVSNGGVLEYFQRERLDQMLRFISANLRPALFFAIEPVAVDHDWRSPDSVPFGEELSFSHNYADLFYSNGFEILHQRATDYDSWRMVATIARAKA